MRRCGCHSSTTFSDHKKGAGDCDRDEGGQQARTRGQERRTRAKQQERIRGHCEPPGQDEHCDNEFDHELPDRHRGRMPGHRRQRARVPLVNQRLVPRLDAAQRGGADLGVDEREHDRHPAEHHHRCHERERDEALQRLSRRAPRGQQDRGQHDIHQERQAKRDLQDVHVHREQRRADQLLPRSVSGGQMRRVAQPLEDRHHLGLVEGPAELGLSIVEARAQVLGQFGDDVCPAA